MVEAKAVLVTTGAVGATYVHDGWDRITTTPALLRTFSRLAHATSRSPELPGDLLAIQGDHSVTRLLKPLADEAPLLLQSMCVEIGRELARLFLDLPVGRWVSIA